MGGPCLIDSESSNTDSFIVNGKYYVYAPSCTDNFQVVKTKFLYDGSYFYSCEQAFQAMKWRKGSETRRILEEVEMDSNESDEEFGNRCWSLGQVKFGNETDRLDNWDFIKVKKMLSVNRAKYAQHEESRQNLLSTGRVQLHGNPYTTTWEHQGHKHSWATWNGLIQNLIREEIRINESERDKAWIESLIRQIGVYSYSSGSNEVGNLGQEVEDLRSYGLDFPYNCSVCTYEETSFPTSCSICGSNNDSYKFATQRRSADREAMKMRTPVLLVTDIGADIDDTLALMTLIGSENLFLAGVVTTVNDGVKRASLARQWLRILADVTLGATVG